MKKRLAAAVGLIGVSIGLWLSTRTDPPTRRPPAPLVNAAPAPGAPSVSAPSPPVAPSIDRVERRSGAPGETILPAVSAPPAHQVPAPKEIAPPEPPAEPERQPEMTPRAVLEPPAPEPPLPEAVPLPEPSVPGSPAMPLASPAPAVPTGPSAQQELDAIQDVIGRYEQMYDRLDAQAVAAIWPLVDSRALARIFSQLQRQDLSFDSCVFALSDAKATAQCDGWLRYVPRVGSPTTRSEHHLWTIHLERAAGAWSIVQVTAR
jgi:hypothetical protein